VAGRFGNNGQTDYSAANDLLCKLSAGMRQWRPATRGIAIDWTAWGHIGMASRGSVPQVMKALGIDMLPPEAGVPTVRRELTYGGTRGEVVVAGRLGAWMEEQDPTGGLDLARAAAHVASRQPGLPLVGEIKAAFLFGGIQIETRLDPRVQPFLYDHTPDAGTPWLPGVMAAEALAEASSALVPGYSVAAVENVRMLNAFKFFHMEPRTLHLSATITIAADSESGGAGRELVARAILRSVTAPAREGLPVQIKDHFSADVRLVPEPLPQQDIQFAPPPADTLATQAEDIYKVFFHGPAYRVLESATVDGRSAIGLIALDLPPDVVSDTTGSHNGAGALMAPRLVESCFQAAALWSIHNKQAMAFPLGIGSVAVCRWPERTNGDRLYACVSTGDDGGTFDGYVVDGAGHVYVNLLGYRTVARPGVAQPQPSA
jgi:hypothetical protein